MLLPEPRYADGYGPRKMQCMSLACQQQGRCTPYMTANGMVYPPDCSTGAVDKQPFNPYKGYQGHPYGDDMRTPTSGAGPTVGPIGQSPTASSPAPFDIVELFQGMSTTTLLVIGAVAYFMFFKKGR